MQTTPKPPQPSTDAEARLLVDQIIGRDPGAPSAFHGNWHQALKDTAARWASSDADDSPADPNTAAPATS